MEHIMNKKMIAGGIAALAMSFLPAAVAVATPANADTGDNTVTITNNHSNSLLQYDKSEKATDPDHIITGEIPINGNTAGFVVKAGQNTKAASAYFTVVDANTKQTLAVVDMSIKRAADGSLSVGPECGGLQCSWSQDNGNWTINVT
jgi:hypothetical protein